MRSLDGAWLVVRRGGQNPLLVCFNIKSSGFSIARLSGKNWKRESTDLGRPPFVSLEENVRSAGSLSGGRSQRSRRQIW